ncbi:MAG: HD family hydrolase [Spirochaetaceae bacterium]|nr:MAG: HD family hydrolase [Spirochaetaceae bacterium]
MKLKPDKGFAEHNSFAERVISLFAHIHPLDRVPRAGFILRGVPVPENVAAHSHFVSLLVMLFAEEHPGEYNAKKAVDMAILHDLPEALLMDIPMPVGDKIIGNSKRKAEMTIFNEFFSGFPATWSALFEEMNARITPEARLVAALDKVQMMLKILSYEKANWGNLAEFWENPDNFRDWDIPGIKELFFTIAKAAGKKLPKKRA